MKYTIRTLTMITLFAAFILTGCDSPANEMEDAETSEIESTRDMKIAANELEEEIRVYRVENAERFREFNRTTSEIELQIENESDKEVRDRLQTKLDKYEETQRDLNHEMDNYQVSENENWDEFEDSFSYRMDDLGDSLDDFFSTNNTNTSSIN